MKKTDSSKKNVDEKAKTKVAWGAFVTGFLLVNITVFVSALLFKFTPTGLLITSLAVQPVVYFLTGLLMGFWVGYVPKYEVIGVVVGGFAGTFWRLIQNEFDAGAWLFFVIGLVVSGVAIFGGAFLGESLKRK